MRANGWFSSTKRPASVKYCYICKVRPDVGLCQSIDKSEEPMKEMKLETSVQMYTLDELSAEYRNLYEAAYRAAENAYAPYSRFHVGAAVLLENGAVVAGNNQENAAYPSGLCAERTALFYAGARYPDSAVQMLAVAAMKDGKRLDGITPCGACRQVMLEAEQRFGRPMVVLLCGNQGVSVVLSAKSLLPLCFGQADLG